MEGREEGRRRNRRNRRNSRNRRNRRNKRIMWLMLPAAARRSGTGPYVLILWVHIDRFEPATSSTGSYMKLPEGEGCSERSSLHGYLPCFVQRGASSITRG